MDKYYVTTAIPYVNAQLHVGNAMDYVMADVLARYARQHGKQVIFSTGTDEHGAKIAEKAAELDQPVQTFVDTMSAQVKDLFKLMNISHDRFVRTTDKGHEQRAQLIWQSLAKDIYKNKYVGWYCTGDEEFFTETTVKENHGICPDHNRPYERVEEENYFFKLSAYSGQVKEAIESGAFKVVPDVRRNEILGLLKEGLDDISISRPTDKLTWGVPVPGDSAQVMYVWFEALMNYLTVLGYPEHDDFKKFWPPDVQVIGKGILRFHAGIWPGMLLALNLPLPKMLYVHGYATINGQKISKTIGNVILPTDVIKQYGADAFRYYLLRHIPSYTDGDFSQAAFEAAYNNELANELGNAVQRTLAMIVRYQNGLIGEMPPAEHDTDAYREALAECRFDRALDDVWEQIRGLNQYIDEEKPWAIAKTGDETHLREVLAYCAGCLLQIADLLLPFLPETAAKIHTIFKDGVIHPGATTLFPKKETAHASTSADSNPAQP